MQRLGEDSMDCNLHTKDDDRVGKVAVSFTFPSSLYSPSTQANSLLAKWCFAKTIEIQNAN